MAIKIKANFSVADIKKTIEARIERIEKAIIQKLSTVGEKFVTNARVNANFTDHTRNLRGSIGFIILKNGIPIDKNFNYDKPGGKIGENIAMKVSENFPKGFVLIVVAGMDYAAAVESKNFDVLTASSLKAEVDLKEAIKALKGINEKLK